MGSVLSFTVYHFSPLLLLFLFDVLFLRKLCPHLESATVLNHRVYYFLYQNSQTHSDGQQCTHLYLLESKCPSTLLELTSCHVTTLHLCLQICLIPSPPPLEIYEWMSILSQSQTRNLYQNSCESMKVCKLFHLTWDEVQRLNREKRWVNSSQRINEHISTHRHYVRRQHSQIKHCLCTIVVFFLYQPLVTVCVNNYCLVKDCSMAVETVAKTYWNSM